MTQYESPITLVAGEIQTTMEANCLKVVQSYGFDVNAKELAKALAYDRDQYDKGYADARKKYERPHGKWADYSEEGFIECPFCHKATTCEDNIDELHYCWNCGAKLRKGGAE